MNVNVMLDRRNFFGIIGAAAGTVVLAGCGGTSAGTSTDAKKDDASGYTLVQPGKIIVASDLANPPFDFVENNEPKGFEVDLMKKVAEKLGLECEYLPAMKFDSIIPLIKQGGKADVAIAGITITDDRQKEVDFTEPYLDSNQAIVVKKDSGETEDSLNVADKKVACQSGTTGDDWISENLPAAERVPLDDVTAALTGVSTGLYSAMVIDLPVASYMLTQSFSDLEVAKEIPTGEQYGIAVSKDQPALTEALNKALTDMESDGTMKDIKTKWFGSEI